jgi:hypothetical protein
MTLQRDGCPGDTRVGKVRRGVAIPHEIVAQPAAALAALQAARGGFRHTLLATAPGELGLFRGLGIAGDFLNTAATEAARQAGCEGGHTH